jgi:branched-chain amino acid transport system permease protein
MHRMLSVNLLKNRLLLYALIILIFLFLIAAPLFLGKDIINILMKILVFGLAAMALDLVFGYSGLWSFGHGGIMGVGAYTVCILMWRFSVYNFWLLAVAGLVASVMAAAIFAGLGLRMRGLYFMLITFALGELVAAMARTFRSITNGTDGIWPMRYPEMGFGITLSHAGLFYFVLVIVIICGLVLYRITRSPFGYSLQSLAENEVRARTLGYNTQLRRFIAFLTSGFFVGLAGVLYVYTNGGVSPPDAGMGASGLLMILVILGGVGTIWGGLVGSAVMMTLNYFISLLIPDRWPIILGAIFILTIFFARGGLYPRIANGWKKAIGYGNIEG